ncbi:hypothetical protein GXW74_05280, partial [Roseomonas eburnea]|nr:hypothetical protein [Neoroseomonas eburnea]
TPARTATRTSTPRVQRTSAPTAPRIEQGSRATLPPPVPRASTRGASR